jgi:hypothetical protein
MSSEIFKVLFKGKKDAIQEKYSLTFKSVKTGETLKIPAQISIELKRISKSTQNVISIQNISEVIKAGKDSSLLFYNYYLIILFTIKDGSKKGFLIGNEKNQGDVLIGTWPFNEDIDLTSESVIELLKNLISNPQDYKEICLIN